MSREKPASTESAVGCRRAPDAQGDGQATAEQHEADGDHREQRRPQGRRAAVVRTVHRGTFLPGHRGDGGCAH